MLKQQIVIKYDYFDILELPSSVYGQLADDIVKNFIK